MTEGTGFWVLVDVFPFPTGNGFCHLGSSGFGSGGLRVREAQIGDLLDRSVQWYLVNVNRVKVSSYCGIPVQY